MTEPALKQAPESASPNFGDLVEDALLQAKTLVQAELSLARRELSSEVKGAFGSLLLLSIGAMFLQAALVTLGVLLLLVVGVGVAAGVVIAVLGAVGVTCTLLAVKALGSRKLIRTSARLSLDAKQVLETVK
ncbi:MAG: phage holin family protein [Polyangiaceae bacterium]